jgi:hypothetical protein
MCPSKGLDEKLVTFWGRVDWSFYFHGLDWRDHEVESDDDEAKKAPVIDEDRFVALETHPSFVEAMES